MTTCISSTDARGYGERDGRVAPADLAATVCRHLDIDLASQWLDLQGRPQPTDGSYVPWAHQAGQPNLPSF